MTSLSGCNLQPGLYVVATPIGHLADISLRALATLAQADLIACEDTRVTAKLLTHYNLRKSLIAYHEHNRQVAGNTIINHIGEGKSVALVSDAGTPLISDPGNDLINLCISNGFYTSTVPGACAAIAAITLSGTPSDQFVFAGFLSPKMISRKKQLQNYSNYSETIVLYESPRRIKHLLKDIFDVLGNRKIAVAKELTKKFETIWRGTVEEVARQLENVDIRGEFVVMIERGPKSVVNISDEMIYEVLKSSSAKDAAKFLSDTYGTSKKEMYQRILSIK